LSYSRKDKEIVVRLKRRLDAAGYDAWIDVEGIRGGDQWRRAIAEEIRQRDTFLLLLSSNSVQSDNVCKELNLAEENKSRVIPVAISSVAIPPEMQYQLAGVQRIDLATDFEAGLKQLLEALGGSDVPVAGQQAASTSGQGPSPTAASPDTRESKQGSLPWLGIGLVVTLLVIVVIVWLFVQSWNDGNGAKESEPIPSTEVVAQAIPNTGTASNTPTDTPTGTATATAPPTGTATPTIAATATATPSGTPTPTNSPTATPTATPRFAPTEYKAGEYFDEIWRELGAGESDLGYPSDREISSNIVVQNFEKGVMYWWENPNGQNYIWVLPASTPVRRGGTRWNRYDDEWEDGKDEVYTCPEARDGGGPIRGFGKVWCEQKLWDDLGACELEEGSSDRCKPEQGPRNGRVQVFQGGVILYNPIDDEVYVLFDQIDQKEWKRF
jgi:hypothetical protein